MVISVLEKDRVDRCDLAGLCCLRGGILIIYLTDRQRGLAMADDAIDSQVYQGRVGECRELTRSTSAPRGGDSKASRQEQRNIRVNKGAAFQLRGGPVTTEMASVEWWN